MRIDDLWKYVVWNYLRWTLKIFLLDETFADILIKSGLNNSREQK